MTTLICADALADNFDYAMSPAYGMGCEANPVMLGCLSCPLPVCKYDDPGIVQRQISLRASQRAEEARRLYANGMRVAKIAARFGLSERAIYHYVEKQNKWSA